MGMYIFIVNYDCINLLYDNKSFLQKLCFIII